MLKLQVMQVKVVNVYLELEFNTFSIAYIFEGRFDEALNI